MSSRISRCLSPASLDDDPADFVSSEENQSCAAPLDGRLEGMDRVRFGRALGYGARHAAKTLTQAIDAASAPGSNQSQSRSPGTEKRPAEPARRPPSAPPPIQRAAQTLDRLHKTGRQAKRASGSLLQPVKRFSGVLWLQVTGLFFALIALTMAFGAWHDRAAFHQSPGSHAAMKLYIYLAVFVLFTYFSVSSFVRAERR